MERSPLLALGLTDDAVWRRARAGAWEEVFPGVCRVAGARRSWQPDLLAACLWAGPPGVASHRAAAGLWRLEGFGEGLLEISAPKRRRTARTALIVHRFVPDRRFVTDAQGIPVTNVSRTLMDLAGVVEAEPLERALDYAIRLQMTSVLQLRWGIARLLGPGRRGVGVLSRLLDDRGPGSVPSVTDFQGRVRKLLAGAGLEAVEEYEIRGDGSHSGRLDLQHDRTRRNAEVEERLEGAARDVGRPQVAVRRGCRGRDGSPGLAGRPGSSAAMRRTARTAGLTPLRSAVVAPARKGGRATTLPGR